MSLSSIVLIFLLVLRATAHMSMATPPSLRYQTNPYKTTVDYDYSAPLSPSGSNYPCKGYQKDLGTPGGKSVATYAHGGTYSIVLAGSATHMGGSCQISLSFDGGNTWAVIKSFIGACVNPDPNGSQKFDFTIPSNVPSGDALLAWTWFNQQGNREMYMNCAVVTISGGRRSIRDFVFPRASGTSLFKANIGNGCSTAAGTDVIFPDPGNDVTYGKSGKTAAPVGNCGASSGTTFTGTDSSETVTPNAGHDCAYWKSKGYICSAGVGLREILPSNWWLLMPLLSQAFF